jgi:hypothetical protein
MRHSLRSPAELNNRHRDLPGGALHSPRLFEHAPVRHTVVEVEMRAQWEPIVQHVVHALLQVGRVGAENALVARAASVQTALALQGTARQRLGRLDAALGCAGAPAAFGRRLLEQVVARGLSANVVRSREGDGGVPAASARAGDRWSLKGATTEGEEGR